jgi:hypothetical protein
MAGFFLHPSPHGYIAKIIFSYPFLPINTVKDENISRFFGVYTITSRRERKRERASIREAHLVKK